MDTSCPHCGHPFGKRKRCYQCSPGKRKTGEKRECATCGKEFYAARWQLADTARRQGTYCSVGCKNAALKGITPPWARLDEKTYHSAGYVLVWAPDHPRASRGRVFEHILVMEAVLGRRLEPGEFVHHKDENKTNNAPDNLEVVNNPDHWKKHAPFNRGLLRKRVTLTCRECGSEFEAQQYQAETRKYCSRACFKAMWNREVKPRFRKEAELCQ